MEAPDVASCVQLLGASNPVLVEQALQQLTDVAAAEDTIGELKPCFAEILEYLPGLLTGPHEMLILLSAWFVSNASAIGDDDIRAALCDPSVLHPLSEALRRKFEDPQIKETIIWAIVNLSLSPNARLALAETGVRTVLTQLFVMGDLSIREKAIQAIRNFLVDDQYCLEFYEAEALLPTVSLLESSEVAAVELCLASLTILAEVLEGLPLELVDANQILSSVVVVMKNFDEDTLQDLALQLVLQLFLSGEVDSEICSSEVLLIACERLNWLNRTVQSRAVTLLSHVSVNATARDQIKTNPIWASVALETAAGDPAAQEPAMRLLANMSVDSQCRRLLREKTNSVKILSALHDSLSGESLELCSVALANLNVFDPADSYKRASFREARPSTGTFAPVISSAAAGPPSPPPTEAMTISYPGDPRFKSESLPISVVEPPSLKQETLPIDSPSGLVEAISSPPEEANNNTPSSQSMFPPRNFIPSKPSGLLAVAVQSHASDIDIDAATMKLLRQRENVANELLLTETAYVASLTAVQSALRQLGPTLMFPGVNLLLNSPFPFPIDNFVFPLRKAVSSGKPVLMDSEIHTLFSVTEVLCNLHSQFFAKIRERMAPGTWDVTRTCLADIFSSYAPRLLKAYKPYINNFDEALALLNNDVLWKRKEWVQFFKEASTILPDLSVTGLGHFLIQPLHRVPRYTVLLENLRQFTPQAHPDRDPLDKAIEKVKEITDQLNAALTLAEHSNKIVSIDLMVSGLSHSLLDNSRRFHQEGQAFLVVTPSDAAAKSEPSSTKGTSVFLFLFTDVLLVAKLAKSTESNPSTPPTNRQRSATLNGLSSSLRLRAAFCVALVDITNVVVPDEDPEECKLCVVCSRPVSPEVSLKLNPATEQTSFSGDLTLIFSKPTERDDWLNSISRLRNSAMARVMRARRDSQLAVSTNDDLALAALAQVLRRPPFVVKRNLAKAQEWRESTTAEMLTTYKSFRLKRGTGSQTNLAAQVAALPAETPKQVETASKVDVNKSRKSFVQSALSKARRAGGSKKMSRMGLPGLKQRLDGAGRVLDAVEMLLPVARDSSPTSQVYIDPFVVSTYRNCGTYCICAADSPSQILVKNDSKLLSWRFRQPYIVSLHEDMQIQVYNMETEKKELFSALAGIPEAANASSFKPRAATVVADWNRIAVVLTMGGVYKVVLYRFVDQSGDSTTSVSVLQHQASVTLFMPMDPMARAAYAIVPKHNFCRLEGESLLLACYDQWQIWSLVTSELVHFDTNNLDGTITTFHNISWSHDFLAAVSGDSVFVWSISQRQRLYTLRPGFVVSAVSLDETGILLGSSAGHIAVRTHVNSVFATSIDPKHGTDGAVSNPSLAYFEDKINSICRIRWRNVEFVLSASDSAGLHLWHPDSATLIKQFKSRGHHAVAVAVVADNARVLVRRRSAKPSGAGSEEPVESPSSSSYEIWQLNFKFIDKWIAEHMDALDQIQKPMSAASPSHLHANRNTVEMQSQPSSRIPLPDSSGSDEAADVSQKSLHVVALGIPITMGPKMYPWMSTIMFRNGTFVTVYKGTGAIHLKSDSGSVVLEHSSTIIAWCRRDPLFITLHRNGALQVVDCAKCAVTATFQAQSMIRAKDGPLSMSVAADTVSEDSEEDHGVQFNKDISSASHVPLRPFGDENPMEMTLTPHQEKESSVVVLADPENQRIAVVRAYDTRYVVWELQLLSSVLLTSVRKVACTLPHSQHASTQVLRLEQSLCSYWNGHLLLGCRTELQLWHLDSARLIRRVFCETPAPSANNLPTFRQVACLGSWAFASAGDNVFVLNLTDSSDPSPASLFMGSPVTEMSLTDDTLIIGTFDGMIFAFPLTKASLADITLPELLSRSVEARMNSFSQHPSFAVRKLEGLQRRVNSIVRKGKLVFAGHEGNCIAVWSFDPHMGAAQPIFIKEYLTQSPIVTMEVRQSSVYALIRSSVASLGSVGLELLVVNIAPLLTSSGLRDTLSHSYTAAPLSMTFTTDGGGDANDKILISCVRDMQQHAAALGTTVSRTIQLLESTHLLDAESALRSVEEQLRKALLAIESYNASHKTSIITFSAHK